MATGWRMHVEGGWEHSRPQTGRLANSSGVTSVHGCFDISMNKSSTGDKWCAISSGLLFYFLNFHKLLMLVPLLPVGSMRTAIAASLKFWPTRRQSALC